MSLPTKPCHNCRRRRLRCDRSLPQCNKCTDAGQECLGYQALFIWTPGIASRGKMSGLTFEDMKRKQITLKHAHLRPEPPSSTSFPQNRVSARVSDKGASSYLQKNQLFVQKDKVFKEDIQLSWGHHVTDPLFQDLGQDARFYISYFNYHVCKELVMYDVPGQNPFRDLIPLATQYPSLLYIILAISALHLSNALQRSGVKSFDLQPQSPRGTVPGHVELSESQSSIRYADALTAKQRALRLLSSTLNNFQSAGIDAALASVLLFIEFELSDSGGKDWRLHINGARELINSVKESYQLQYSDMSSLRRCLISNCLVYDVLGSSLTSSKSSGTLPCSSTIMYSSLQYAETNNYLSFPAILLHIVSAAAQLSQEIQDASTKNPLSSFQESQAFSLFHAAQSFNATAWASTLHPQSPNHAHLETRIHIASAHQAAVCIYLSRILLSFSLSLSLSSSTTKFKTQIPDTDNLSHHVFQIIYHLSFITPDSELFKATSWPTFVAGAETGDREQQAWAMDRLRQLWECLPCTMGYVRSAMEVLGVIWDKREAACRGNKVDWIQELKMSEIDCMIV